MTPEISRRIAAEAIGTSFLLAIVVGSGVMGETLADGNIAVALLANSLATGAGLYVLISIFGPISGAHLNPAVTFAFAVKGETTPLIAAAYFAAQIAGGCAGVFIAHAMFGMDVLEVSDKARHGGGQVLGEIVATFGLTLTILLAVRRAPERVAACVALYITAAYWFTSSTSFANPAVTIARTLTDSFAGIRPVDAPAFIAAEFLGAGAAVACAALFEQRDARKEDRYSALP